MTEQWTASSDLEIASDVRSSDGGSSDSEGRELEKDRPQNALEHLSMFGLMITTACLAVAVANQIVPQPVC